MFYIGVDLGQRRDFSAIAVIDSSPGGDPRFQDKPWMQSSYKVERMLVVRHLERLPLGTLYSNVTARVLDVVRHRDLSTAPRRLVVDPTGVGKPVVEMLQAAKPGCEIMPVILTAGDHENNDGKIWHVPKVDLMGELQAVLERRELQISRRIPETETLLRELKDVSLSTGFTRRPRIGADGANQHDDLVIAVALACWSARKLTPAATPGRLFW